MLTLLGQIAPDPDAVEAAVPDGLRLRDWLLAAAVVAASVLASTALRVVVRRTIGRRNRGSAQLVGRLSTIVVVSVGLVYALSSIGVDVGLLVGALGIGGVVVAFAFQDILENFVAGIILQIKRPFVPGDIVEAGASRPLGIVRDVDSRSVLLDQFSGERVVLPAAEVLKNQIVNWTRNPARRIGVPVQIPYRVDPQEAIDAIQPRLGTIEEVLPLPPPRVLVSDLAASGVTLTCYVWHDAFGDIFWIEHRVRLEAKRGLEAAGIEIPFPQRVVTFADPVPDDPGPDDEDARPGG